MSKEERNFLEAAVALSLLVLGLVGVRFIMAGTWRYGFIPGNLALAWLGYASGWWLTQRLARQLWSTWQNILLTIVWIFFLPNTWYVITDFIHLYPTGEISVVFDAVLLGVLTMTGFLLGFRSLLLVHRQLLRRFKPARAYQLVEAIILTVSFAIYLGRILRWNSWDALSNPGGLILTVSDRIIDPLGHPSAINMTSLFFVTLSVGYFAVWRLAGGFKSTS